MSAPVVFFGLLAHRNAAATQWSAPVCPGGGSADFDHRPLVITTCSRNGSSGWKIIGYLKSFAPTSRFGSPGPPASGTHHPGAAPCGTKMPVKRVLGFAAVLLINVCAGIIESSSGNASAIPAPRRIVRLDMCFLVMNMITPPLFIVPLTRCPNLVLPVPGVLFFLIHLERLALHNAQYQR